MLALKSDEKVPDVCAINEMYTFAPCITISSTLYDVEVTQVPLFLIPKDNFDQYVVPYCVALIETGPAVDKLNAVPPIVELTWNCVPEKPDKI